MKRINTIAKTLFLSIALLICTACENQYEYRENDVDLYSIAYNSVLGTSVTESDKILILEIDNYGRKLFAYEAFTNNGTEENGRVFAILVSQKTTEKKAFFYDNVDCLTCPMASANENIRLTEQQVESCFTEEQISALKTANDWNKPLDESKFFEIKVSTRKGNTVSKYKLKMAFLTVASEEEYDKSELTLLTTDKNGNSIYYIRVKPTYAENIDYIFTKSYVVMFDKNGDFNESTGIMEIEDVWDYQEQLAAFKEANSWNE